VFKVGNMVKSIYWFDDRTVGIGIVVKVTKAMVEQDVQYYVYWSKLKYFYWNWGEDIKCLK
jgi:hypothetical protein